MNVVEHKWDKKLKEFLKQYYNDEIMELATKYPDKRSLIIDFINIEVFSKDIASDLLETPDTMIEAFERALFETDIPFSVPMENAHVRIVNLPARIPIRDLRSKNISKFIAVEGMIRRATEVRPKILKAAFRCLRCENITFVEQPGNRLEEPFAGCENENCQKKWSV